MLYANPGRGVAPTIATRFGWKSASIAPVNRACSSVVSCTVVAIHTPPYVDQWRSRQ